MKTRLLLITLFLILGLLVIYVVTIPKSYTWNYELPNEYFIKKESDTRIILGLNDEIKVDDYVAEFSYGDRYILLKSLDNTDGLVVKFYIIDSLNNDIYGPYLDYEDFINKKKEIVDEKIGKWIKTINYSE